MEQFILDLLGQLGLIALACGLTASAITNQMKSQFNLTGWRVLAIQEALSVVIAVLILIVTSCGAPQDIWVWIQHSAAGLLGGLIVATGWDFAKRLSTTEVSTTETVIDEPETDTTYGKGRRYLVD